MKVLFITRLYLPHIGGVERHIAGLIKHAPRNIQITVLTECHEESLKKLDEPSIIRIPTFGFSERQKKFVIWKWIIKNRSFIDSFDVIHVHDTVFWIYPLWPLIRIKLFCTFHGWEGIYPLPLKNKYQKRLDANLVKKSIAVGEFINKWYGIKADAITYGAAEKTQATPVYLPKKTLLFLGRLDKDTGFDECLSFLQVYPEINIAVLGSGNMPTPQDQRIKYFGTVKNPTPYIHSSEWIYTTGYLGILESFLAKKQIYVSASNPIKKDYLNLHPMAKYLHFDKDLRGKLDTQIPYQWAIGQDYSHLWKIYLNLWQKNN